MEDDLEVIQHVAFALLNAARNLDTISAIEQAHLIASICNHNPYYSPYLKRVLDEICKAVLGVLYLHFNLTQHNY